MEPIKKAGYPLWLILLVLAMGIGCSAQSKKARHLARADKYFAAGEYERAKIEYFIVRKLEPTNSLAFIRLGRIYLGQGSTLQALACLLPARQLAPDDPNLRCSWGELFLSDGKFPEARQEFLKTLEKDPTNTSAILLLPYTALSLADVADIENRLRNLAQSPPAAILLANATLYSKQNKSALAESSVNQALQLAPKMPEAHAAAAMLLINKTNFDAADQEFQKAVDLAPARSPIQLNYANFKSARGDTEGARAILKSVLQKTPDFLSAWDALARLDLEARNYEAALSSTDRVLSQDPLRLETCRLRSIIHTAMGTPQKAVQEWEQVEQQLKNLPGLRQTIKMELARVYVNNRQPEQALRSLDDLLVSISNRLDRSYIEASLLKANVQLSQNRGAEVVNSMATLLQRTNVFQARLLMADGYRQLGRPEEALNIMRRLAAEHPQDAQLAFTMGLLHREQKNTAEARRSFQLSRDLKPPNLPALGQLVDLEIAVTNLPSALKLVQDELAKTNSAPLRYLEGLVFSAQERWQQAEAALTSALQLDASFAPPYYLLTTVYVHNKRLDSAIKELQTLLQRQTNDVRALMLCGTVYSEMGKFEQSRQAYESLLANNPRFFPALNNLAYLYSERLGKLDKGYELARRAWALSPHEGGIADTLGWISYKKGDYQQALPLLRQAAELLPANAEIQFHLGMTSYMIGQTSQAQAALQRAVASKDSFLGKGEAQRRLALLNGSSTSVQNSISELEASVKSQPRDVSSRLRLAELYEASGDFKKAAVLFEEASKLNPQLLEPPLRLGRIFSGPVPDPDRALAFAQKASDLAPDSAEANWLLGRLIYKRGDHLRAYALLHLAVRQSAGSDVLYDYSWAAYSLGRLADAAQAMQQALLGFKAGSSQAIDARVFLDFDDLNSKPLGLPAAEQKINATLSSNPAYVPALLAQATLNRQRGRQKTAMDLYENILRTFPNFAPATRELALLTAADPDNQEKAYKLASKAREALPDDMELARVLGILSYQKRDYPYARTLFEQVSASNPNDPEVFFRLGLAHLQLKDKARGKQALERALALNLRGDFEKQAKQELARLQ